MSLVHVHLLMVQTKINCSPFLPASGETSITAGNYIVPFTFTLPFNIPPTYQGKYGNVIYSANICLKETGIFSSTKSYTVPFVVSNPTTNIEQRPLRLAAETDKYGCCDNNRGNFKIDVNTDFSAYFPGQPVLINGFAINENPEDTTMRVNMSLVLNETFYGRRTHALKSKTKRHKIVDWDGVRPAASRIDFTNQRTFDIPDVQESDMRHCQFIDTCYTLEFSMELPGACSGALETGSPVIILGRMSNPPTQTAVPSAPVDLSISNVDRIGLPPTGPPVIPLPMPEAPPSYFEATKKDSDFLSMPAAVQSTGVPAANQSQSGPNQTSYYDWSQSAFTYT